MNCYDSDYVDVMLGYRSMFNASLEQACFFHQSVIEEVAESILEWAVPVRQAIPVLLGLGYTSVQISDAIRLLKDTSEEDCYNSVEVELEEEEEAA